MELVSRGLLVGDVQRRVHLTFGTLTKPITLNDLYLEMYESCSTFSGLLRAADVDDGFFLRSDVVSLDADDGTLDFAARLSSRLVALNSLRILHTSSETTPVRRAQGGDWFNRGVASHAWSAARPFYRLVGNGIELYPAPTAPTVLMVSYTSEIDCSPTEDWSATMAPGWRRWIAADLCRKVSVSENNVGKASMFERERDDVWSVITAVSARDNFESLRIRDVEGWGF